VDAQKVDSINRGMPPVHEPELAELLRESGGRLQATRVVVADIRGAVFHGILPYRGLDRGGDWGFGLVDLGAEKKQRPEHDDHCGCEDQPKPANGKLRAIARHGQPPSVLAECDFCHASGSILRYD
jgi:hypothetical protein